MGGACTRRAPRAVTGKAADDDIIASISTVICPSTAALIALEGEREGERDAPCLKCTH